MNISLLSDQDLTKYNIRDYYDNLSSDLKKALVRYTTSDYSSLNTLLRDGLDPSNLDHRTSYDNESDWVNKLDRIIADGPKLKIPFYVYKGMVLPELITEQIKQAGYLNNLGYVSATLNIDTAIGFAGYSCCLFKIIVTDPQALNYIFVETRKGGQEIVFQRGTHYKLTGSPYKYKYYPPGSNNYQLISLYTITINSGIVVPTPSTVSPFAPIVRVDDKVKTLQSFTRYIELMTPETIDMFYENTDDIPVKIVDGYIREHPYHTVSEALKQNMIGIARQML